MPPILQVIDFARKLILAKHYVGIATQASGDFLNPSDIL